MLVLEAVKRVDAEDETMQYLLSLMFTALDSLMRNIHFYMIDDEVLGDGLKVTKCQSLIGRLVIVFWYAPLRLMEALWGRGPGRLLTETGEADKNWQVVKQEVESNGFTSVSESLDMGCACFLKITHQGPKTDLELQMYGSERGRGAASRTCLVIMLPETAPAPLDNGRKKHFVVEWA